MKKELFERYPALSVCREAIEKAEQMLIDCYQNGGKLMLCGNGGSAADCDHIVGELMKGFLLMRPLSDEKKADMKKNCPEIEDELLCKLQGGLPAVSLTGFNALGSAFCNDVDPKYVYAQALGAMAKKGDLLIAISTSGNAENVAAAAKVARALGVGVIALTGKDGGKLARLSDVAIIAPENETFKIQELHLPIYHYLCAAVEKHFFG